MEREFKIGDVVKVFIEDNGHHVDWYKKMNGLIGVVVGAYPGNKGRASTDYFYEVLFASDPYRPGRAGEYTWFWDELTLVSKAGE